MKTQRLPDIEHSIQSSDDKDSLSQTISIEEPEKTIQENPKDSTNTEFLIMASERQITQDLNNLFEKTPKSKLQIHSNNKQQVETVKKQPNTAKTAKIQNDKQANFGVKAGKPKK